MQDEHAAESALADDGRRRSPARRARADHDQAALPELVEQEAVGDRDRVVGVVLEAIVALVPREDRDPDLARVSVTLDVYAHVLVDDREVERAALLA
jgi:hypothetical protein